MTSDLAELESAASILLQHGVGRTANTTSPTGPATAGIERGPILQTVKLIAGQEVTASYGGQPRRYRLATPAFATPDGALVMVRIDRACPSQAEVYRMDISNHTYLGTARRQP